MTVYNSLSQHSMRIHFTAAIPEPERYVVPCSNDPKLTQDDRTKGRLQVYILTGSNMRVCTAPPFGHVV